MILRSRGAKAPLLSVDLMPVRVGFFPREGGLLSPCSWTCGCEIYIWEYLNDAFEKEEIDSAVEEFEFEAEKLNPETLNELSEENARGLLFDLAYMAVNGLFGGDFHTWNEVLCYSLGFDEETIDYLNY